MKTAYLFIALIICCHFVSFSQNNIDSTEQNYIREIQMKTARNRPFDGYSRPGVATPALENRLSVSQLLSPDSLKNFIQRKSGNTIAAKNPNKRLTKRSQTNKLCIDTSFVRLLNIYASWLYISAVVPTGDGGFLIPALMYDSTVKPNYSWRTFAILLKIDADGKVLWIKQFDNADPVISSKFTMVNAFELSNKDIICVGSTDTTTNGDNHTSQIIFRLDKDGNILWYKGLRPTLYDGITNSYLNINSLAEGLNGDLILCGRTSATISFAKSETIVRIDKTGNLVWDANYGNFGDYLLGAEGLGVYVINGQIVEVGISYGTNNPMTPPAINFLTLDYNTGNLISKRFFRPSYSDPMEEFRKSFSNYSDKCIRQSNGNFVIYGQLVSDFINQTSVLDHFGVVEFDPSFDLVKAYSISSDLPSNFYGNLLYINETGKGLVSLFKYDPSFTPHLYFGSFENQQFLNQRVSVYNNVGLSENSGFGFTKDNGYIFAQSHFVQGIKNSIEFKKMHNSDTSSLCLGTDTAFMRFLPLNIIEDPGYIYLDTNISNQIVPSHYNLTQNDTLKVVSEDPCKQFNYCDTVKIHGNPVICGSQPSIQFSAYKNPECGGIVQWTIDPAGIDSFEIQNDTSLLVHFKNLNWQGKLYATLPTGKCFITARDSITVNVVRLQNGIHLGADTVLCKGNSMALHAGSSFSNYLWQDGSTDSVLLVSNPGKYFVSAGDQCGNHFTDTIIVAAAQFPFSIGADTIRCNQDTVHLTATDGFINYQWKPNYYISADTGRTVSVLPMADATYIASAEKWSGCVVSDTVNIKVFTSPAIHLGNDTSFCVGQSVKLDAGNGFKSYVWSNGATSQQITVSQKGKYFVKATAANSCMSFDTLQIINVTSIPSFTLGNDTVLCRGTIYPYQFNMPGATYLWNDGNTTNQYNVSEPGVYSLTVTQQGCTGRDTVAISYKINPVVALGNDTTICVGTNYLLDASYSNATYLWQDGSTLPKFSVSKAGDYHVEINLDGCIARDTVHIQYLDKPQFTLGKDTTICPGQTILLQPQINVPVNYLWQDGSSQPVFTVKDSGLYSLKVSNSCGSFFDEIVIGQGGCLILLPNAFSPNNDGLNDVFKLPNPYTVKVFHLMIYNRFGEKIFETNNANRGWDGTQKGEQSPQGAYVWIMSYTDNNNHSQQLKGIVTLLR